MVKILIDKCETMDKLAKLYKDTDDRKVQNGIVQAMLVVTLMDTAGKLIVEDEEK